jgi:hypothetical protein
MRFKPHFKKIRFFFGAVVVVTTSGCFQIFGPGPATFIKKSINPSKTTQAILFWKGGNATSGNSLQVSVKDAGDDWIKKKWEIFLLLMTIMVRPGLTPMLSG